jgi:hypothetical protein
MSIYTELPMPAILGFCIPAIWLVYKLNGFKPIIQWYRKHDPFGILLPVSSMLIFPFLFTYVYEKIIDLSSQEPHSSEALEIILKILPPLLSVIVGGVIGFNSSYLMWKRQTEYVQRNIAQALYQELIVLEQRINWLIKKNKELPPFWLGIPPREDRPFYTKDGIFFTCRKEICLFNEELSNRVFEFYMYLLEAEDLREQVDSDSKIDAINRELDRAKEIQRINESVKTIRGIDKADGEDKTIKSYPSAKDDTVKYGATISAAYMRIGTYLKKAYDILPKLKKLLEKEFKTSSL